MMTTRPGIAAVNYDGRVASCRAAGPTDHACGPDTFPFLDRPTGEVGARRAFGPSPPGTSEVAHPSKGKRDDGGLAWTYGASARKPSAPETYGGLVWNNPAGRGSTRVRGSREGWANGYASFQEGIAEIPQRRNRPEKPHTCDLLRPSSRFSSSAFYPLLRHLLRLATTGLPTAGGLNALHSVRSAGRRGHGQPLAM